MRPIAIFIPVLLTLTILPFRAHPDSIILEGKRYTNVYVSPGTNLYYVRFADDGIQISVPQSEVGKRDIRISKDPAERKKISDTWNSKRAKFPLDDRVTITFRQWKQANNPPPPPAPAEIAPSPTATVKPLTNKPRNYSRSRRNRRVFIDREGTQIATNTPGRFQNNEEYVEIQLDYEQIEIPKKFKGRTTVQTADVETFEDIISYYANYYSLDKYLIYAVIKQESNGNPYAVSSAGARGLMQLMPGTAAEMGVRDIFDPAQNIAGGTQYLSKMKKLFGSTTLALAGYNAGPGNVRKYGNTVPPFAETQSYVRRVQQYQRQYQRYGTPQFDLANVKPVEKDYLPPTTEKFYSIILENGLTVRADDILDDGDGYVYIFKGRSGRITKKQVRTIYDPA